MGIDNKSPEPAPKKTVDHGETMRAVYKAFKGPKKMYVNEEAFKKLEGAELVVAKNWRNMDGDRRNTTIDELIGIQQKLEKGAPVAPRQLESFMVLKEVLPKAFGMTIDNVMDLRRGELANEQERGLSAVADKEVLKKLDDDLQKLPPEAEGPAGTLDGVSQDEPLTPPRNPQNPTEETFR